MEIRKASFLFSLLIVVISLSLVAPVDAYRSPQPVNVIRSVEGIATDVSDGDTFKLTTANGTKLKVRTAFYDALETPKIDRRTGKVKKPGQPFGEEVANAFRKKVEGKKVRVDIIDIDRYKRMVGIVWLNGRNITLEMVREGWAQCYRRYLKPPHTYQCIQAEDIARRERKGIWGRSDYEDPANFRKRLR
jgi:endonuclease YncB( thermonuclease family)